MNNVCIVACYGRPEILYYTLRHLDKTKEDIIYLFSVDYGYDVGILPFINEFLKTHDGLIVKRNKTDYRIGKQSYNVLTAYSEACFISGDEGLVFLVEDDVFVHHDFFNWNKLIHAKEKNIFCSINSENNRIHDTTNKVNSYYYGRDNDYQSIGVCFKSETYRKLIYPHQKIAYYSNPQNYCMINFPNSSIGGDFVEQDGLIRRVKEQHPEFKIVFPHIPRCYHAGMWGYNRLSGKKLSGTISEKITKLEKILIDIELYKEYCVYFDDSKPIDLTQNYDYKEVNYLQSKYIGT